MGVGIPNRVDPLCMQHRSQDVLGMWADISLVLPPADAQQHHARDLLAVCRIQTPLAVVLHLAGQRVGAAEEDMAALLRVTDALGADLVEIGQPDEEGLGEQLLELLVDRLHDDLVAQVVVADGRVEDAHQLHVRRHFLTSMPPPR